MNSSTFKTKTFWGGIASIVAGIAAIATTGDFVSGGNMIIIGILAITGRDAIAKVEPPTQQ